MLTTSNAADAWINAATAARALGVGVKAVRRLGDRGRIAMRTIPETRPMYSRADVDRIAAESITPATQLAK